MISSVLVVCTGNICRSPMAAAVLSKKAQEADYRLQVASAGTGALVGCSPPPAAVEVMAETGIDISGHRARQLTDALALRYELILAMEEVQRRWIEQQWPILRGRVHLLGGSEDVPDPYGKPREVFEECLSRINAGVEAWSKRLMQ